MNYIHNQKHREEIPIYIREHVKVISENNQSLNERLALRKCKEIIDQLDKMQ